MVSLFFVILLLFDGQLDIKVLYIYMGVFKNTYILEIKHHMKRFHATHFNCFQ